MRRGAQAARPRLPAFGREILDLRRRGLVPAGRVVVALDTWDYGKNRARVVVAQDADPAALDFSFLAGLDVELVWLPLSTPRPRCDALIGAVLAHRPERLLMWIVGGEQPTELVWIKSKLVGVERAEYA